MKLNPLIQLPGSEAHVEALVKALAEADARSDFRALVAFVRRSEFTERLFKAVESFCRRGGRMDWIVGTDLGGTDGISLQRLLGIQNRFPGSRIRVMKLGGGA